MRYWVPHISDALALIAADGLSNIVGLCMAPHYSQASVGVYFRKLEEAIDSLGVSVNVARIESYHDHPLFIRAVLEKVSGALRRFPKEERGEVKVLFTAHSLPSSLIERGDPYDEQVRRTARLLAGGLGLSDGSWHFCYQSAPAGRSGWLGPQLEEMVTELAESGCTRLLVAPVGFVADHLEVLYDVDVECRELAESRGMRMERAESLNASETFIEALTDIVYGATKTWEM
jgi:ferrochelatase